MQVHLTIRLRAREIAIKKFKKMRQENDCFATRYLSRFNQIAAFAIAANQIAAFAIVYWCDSTISLISRWGTLCPGDSRFRLAFLVDRGFFSLATKLTRSYYRKGSAALQPKPWDGLRAMTS